MQPFHGRQPEFVIGRMQRGDRFNSFKRLVRNLWAGSVVEFLTR